MITLLHTHSNTIKTKSQPKDKESQQKLIKKYKKKVFLFFIEQRN